MDVGTAVGIASLGIQVCQGLLKYYDGWKDFDEDIQRTYQTIAHLNATFSELSKALVDIDQNKKHHVIDSLIACNDNVTRLEKKAIKLQTHQQPKGFREKLTMQRQKATYPFRQSTLVKLREIAIDTQDQLSLALQVLQLTIGIESEKTLKDIADQIQAVKLEIDEVSRQTEQTLTYARRQDERHKLEILDWLAKPDYTAQQATHIREHVPGSGSWLLDKPEFQNWSQATGDFLFIHGAPGAGKTTLSSIIIEHIQEKSEQTDEGLCYFYCDFNRRNEQQLNKILLCLARQLAEPRVDLPTCIIELYNKHRFKQTTPNTSEASRTLLSVAKTYSKLYVIIDALDECHEVFDTQKELITNLLEIKDANILMTSRPLPDIMSVIVTKTKLEIRADDGEIGRYVDENIKRLPGFVSRSSDIQRLVRSSIIDTVRGVYLLAKLLIESLIGSKSPKHLRGILNSFNAANDAYATAYSKTMYRINSQSQGNTQLAIETLTWIVFSRRPIKTRELLYALAIEVDETEFDEENIPDLDQVITSCLGLVIIEEDTQIIRLAHQTIQEYLKSGGSTWLGNGHDKIFHSCLSYLSLEDFKSGICDDREQLERRLTKFPFYAYASECWGYHTYDLEDLSAVDKFLKLNEHVQAASQVLLSSDFSFHISGITGLHLAAVFNSIRLALCALKKQDIDARDSRKRTGLYYAATMGHIDMAHLLLNHGAEIHNFDYVYSDPLLHATAEGQIETVTALLDRNAEINIQDSNGQSALCLAIASSHEAMVALLVDRGARLNLKNNSGNTPLHIAALTDNTSIAAMLIRNGAQIEIQNCSGQTPLSLAAYYGNLNVATLFIDAGAQVQALNDTRVAPQIMKLYEMEGILATLLSGTEAQFDAAGNLEDRARFVAVKKKKEETAKSLLGNRMALLIHRVEDSMLVLQRAALHGHLNAVRYFFEFEATATPIAVMSSVPRINTKQIPVQADSAYSMNSVKSQSAGSDTGLLSFTDQVGRTTLHFAALGGNVEVLEYLLSKGMDRDARDNFGRTILHYASMSSSTPMLRKVLGFAELVNIQHTLWSPLHWAARDGDFDMIKLLIDVEFRCSSISTADPSVSWTPLDVAVYYRNRKLISEEGNLVKAHAWATTAESGLVKIDPQQLVSTHRTNHLDPGEISKIKACDGCEIDITGARFTCQVCEDLDLCFMCKAEPAIETMHPGHDWDRYEGDCKV